MRKAFLFFILVLLGACTSNSKESTPKHTGLKTLSTIGMIEDLVKQIGGDQIQSTILIKGDLDPHSYQLVKGDDEKMASADLIFYNGLGLEHGPSLQLYLKSEHKAIGLGEKIYQNNPELILLDNGQVDPHIWMDISLWSKAVDHIVQALSEKDPVHAEFYQNNGKKLQEQMIFCHQSIKHVLGSVPENKRFLVTSHDAFNYFTRAYLAEEGEFLGDQWRKRFSSPEGLAPESQLSIINIQQIINHLKKNNIQVLFPESNVSIDSIRKIVQAGKELGLDLTIANVSLYSDAMGTPGSDADTYLKMIEHNAKALANYLNKN